MRVTASAVLLAAILVASATASTVIMRVGAAHLVHLGLMARWHAREVSNASAPVGAPVPAVVTRTAAVHQGFVSTSPDLRIAQQTWKDVRERIGAIPEVWHATLVSGDYVLVLLVRTTDASALRDLVLSRLQAIPGVRATHTLLVRDEMGDALAGRPADSHP